jgi:peptidoglycan/LPS O-acetylase OafA/YrhL
VYLWHFAIAYAAGVGGADESFSPVLAITLGLAIPLGALSWYLVERPMMRFKYRLRRPQREPA